MPIPTTAAYYARTSTDEQKERQTIQSQVSALETEITRQGDQLTGRYIDDGCSGAVLDRPALERLRADAREKRFQKLYIYSPDRLARDLMLQLLVVKELRRRGVEVAFLSQRFEDNPADQLLFQMLGAISEFERAQILERTRRGRLHKARAGILIGSIPKFGYVCVHKTESAPARYEINPVEAGTVREIFRLFCSPGVRGVRTLARELHRLGFRNRSGTTKWAKSTLQKTLTDSTYIGTRYYNKYAACEPLKARQDLWYRGNTSRRLRPKTEWFPVKVPPLVTAGEFAAAQMKLARNRDLSDRNAKHEYLVRGLVYCGCGKRMYGYPCHGEPRYKCADKYLNHPLPKTCRQPTVAAPALDRAIWAAFKKVLDRPEIVAARMNQLKTDRTRVEGGTEGRKAEAQRAQAALADQEQRFLDAYAAKVIDLAQLESRLQALAAQKKLLTEEMQRIEGGGASAPAPLTEAELRGHFDSLKQKARAASFLVRQEIIRLFAKRVEVSGNTVRMQAFLPSPVSAAATTDFYYARNVHHPFDVAFDLREPHRITIRAISQHDKDKLPMTK